MTAILKGKKAIMRATTNGVIIILDDAVLEGTNFINPSSPTEFRASDEARYDTVDEYARHRGLCTKTVRKLLPQLPHSTIGGIRIRRSEADKILDNLTLQKKRRKGK